MKSPVVALFVLTLIALTLVTNVSARQSWGDLFLKAAPLDSPEPGADRWPADDGLSKSRSDTVCFGGHDGNGYAVLGGIWDFDDGTLQGWYGVDMHANSGGPWFQRMTAADYECPESAPMILGTTGQLWAGRQQAAADSGCWVCDAGESCSLGYENNLCQVATSPELPYSGGDIVVEFSYFLDLEGWPYDFISVDIVAMETGEELEVLHLQVPGMDGNVGIIGDPDNPAFFSDSLDAADIPVGTDGVRIRFRFLADGGWSDEDAGGGICSTYGPFGADSVVVTETGVGVLASYDFDESDEGWTAESCASSGHLVDVHSVDLYDFPDGCDCERLMGHVLTFHDENFEHPGYNGEYPPEPPPSYQYDMAVSPIVDRSAVADLNGILARFDIFGDMPLNNGVLFRPGWMYYPYTCEASGYSGWSPRSGQSVWNYLGQEPVCEARIEDANADGIPGDRDLYRFTLEVLSCCSCFGVGDNCTGETNATPLFDNIEVCFTSMPDAPALSFPNGVVYQDGFAQADGHPYDPGRSDTWTNASGVVLEPPYILSDSLAVYGPYPSGSTPSWEAQLWFRLARTGPEIHQASLAEWKSRFSGDPEAGFVSARMDSCQIGVNAFSNRVCSYFHEEDPGFDPGYPDLTDENEILPDDLFTPGTKIEYFVTGNWIGSNERFLLPDTTGGNFLEFEILPGIVEIGYDWVWPCFLYVDAYDGGAQPYIEEALNRVLPEMPSGVSKFDRYDQPGSATNFNGNAIYRIDIWAGANNGARLDQLLAYRTILVNTGSLGSTVLDEADYIGYEDWLRTTICGYSTCSQGLILNGESVAASAWNQRPAFLVDVAGAAFECAPYYAADCPPGSPADASPCVELVDAEGEYEGPVHLYAYANACPQEAEFSVLLPVTGTGNKSWYDYDMDGPKETVEFAQIVNEKPFTESYRVIVDGFSYHHLTRTFDGSTCTGDDEGIVDAIAAELIRALNWIHAGRIPICNYDLPCINVPDNPCPTVDAPGDVVELPVNRLYAATPNPFHPRAAIRFSLASAGRVEIVVFDASGRRVRTVVDERYDAGLHTTVWDGTDNLGRRVASGVYWVQMRAADYVSTKRMMVLK